MKKKVIAVDIDGVLADWVGTCIPILNEIIGKSVPISEVRFDMHKVYKISEQEMHKAIENLYKIISIRDVKPIKGSRKAIRTLGRDFKVIAVTGRPKSFHDDTQEWLKKYFGADVPVMYGHASGNPFGSGVHNNSKEKICKDNSAVCLIEDNASEIIAFMGSETEPL